MIVGRVRESNAGCRRRYPRESPVSQFDDDRPSLRPEAAKIVQRTMMRRFCLGRVRWDAKCRRKE